MYPPRETYFVLTANDDGGLRVEGMTKDELLKRITPGPRGDRYYGGEFPLHLTSDPSKVGDGYLEPRAGTTIMVIVGQAVMPKAVEVATRYELP